MEHIRTSSKIRFNNMQATGLSQNIKLGAILALVAFFIHSSNDTITKLISTQGGILDNAVAMQPFQLILITNICANITYFIIAMGRGGLSALVIKRASVKIILLRAVLSILLGFVVIFSFKTFSMTQVYTMIFATPLLVTVLSVLFLGEKVRWRRWTATTIGFIGVLIAVRPSHTLLLNPIELFPLLIAVLSAIVLIITMKAIAVERSITVAYWNSLFMIVILAVPVILTWQSISSLQLLLSIISGILGGTAFFLILEANRFMPASQFAPLQYSQFIWGLVLDWQVFGILPKDIYVYIGAAIIIGSGIYTMERKRKVRIERFKPRSRKRLWLYKKNLSKKATRHDID